MNDLKPIVDAIFARSRALGLTQTELAKQSGVARETLSRLTQRCDADFGMLNKLCRTLDLRLEVSEPTGLRLSFPYNWSNSAMSTDSLIVHVLERGIFVDVLEISRYFGLERVRQQFKASCASSAVMDRMLRNIETGFLQVEQLTS